MPFNSKVHQREEENVPRTIVSEGERRYNAAKHAREKNLQHSQSVSTEADSMQS
jgi:hypothetical protein